MAPTYEVTDNNALAPNHSRSSNISISLPLSHAGEKLAHPLLETLLAKVVVRVSFQEILTSNIASLDCNNHVQRM